MLTLIFDPGMAGADLTEGRPVVGDVAEGL
jgi:hypothetical protein